MTAVRETTITLIFIVALLHIIFLILLELPNRPVNVGANIKQSTSGGVCDRVEAERSTSDRGEEMEAKEAEGKSCFYRFSLKVSC